MTYTRQAASYRDLEVMSATPDRLVLILFDHLSVQLERIKLGLEREDHSLQLIGASGARDILAELLATLDFDNGGPIAVQLADLYQYMLMELIDITARRDIKTLVRISAIVVSLREAFAGAAEQLGSAAAMSA